MKSLYFISALFLMTVENATAQSVPVEKPTEKAKAVESETLREFKTDVLSLSYKKDGRRVFLLRAEDGMDAIVQDENDLLQDQAKRPRNAQRKNRKNGKKRGKAIREFEVACNPLGEATQFDVTTNDTQEAMEDIRQDMRHKRMRRLAELACLEPEFESE